MSNPRWLLLALALMGNACSRSGCAPAEPTPDPATPEARRTPDPAAMSVYDLLAKGPSSLADTEVIVHGRVSQPFMTCRAGTTCEQWQEIAPIMILGDGTAAGRELWVILCPEASSGFSPEVGMLVDVTGVVLVDGRGGVQLEHRETVFLPAQ